MNFRIVIFTRDSARWIGAVARAYRRLGLRPLYLVHDKTADATASILRELGEDAKPISFPKDIVESGVAQLPDFVKEDWVLRMDDDEFPSRRMIEFTKKAVTRTREHAIMYARLAILSASLPLQHMTRECFYPPRAPFLHDPQVRTFRHREVVYTDEIHTPGFIPESLRLAPSDAYFVHLTEIIRSPAERLAKLVHYEIEKPGSGTVPLGISVVHELPTREFDPLAKELDAIERPTEGKEAANLEPEIVQRVRDYMRDALTKGTPTSVEEEKLVRIRERLEAMPRPLRALFELV